MPLAFGDKCFIERGYVSPLNTFTAQRFIFDDAFDTAKDESEIIRIIERTEKRYSSQPFLEKLTLYADSLIDKKTIRGGMKMSKTITPIELRANVLMASKNIVNVLNEPDMKQLLTAYHKELYQTTFEKYERLIKQEYKIAVASAQSAGKSTVMNGFVFEYPVLPSCNVETTCVPTILRYGKEISVSVEIQKIETLSNNRTKVAKVRTIEIPCELTEFEKRYGTRLFDKLLQYFVDCYHCIALDNIVYFTKQPIHTYKGTITVNDLTISKNNPKHLAMLLVCVLCAYMNTNTDSDKLLQSELETRAMQQQLLNELGIENEEKDYSVTLFWNAELLKKGLVFYDLPGLDSGTEAANGYRSTADITLTALDEVQSMLFLFKAEAAGDGLDAISAMMNREAIRSLSSSQARVVVGLNKIDRLPDETAIEASLNRAKIKLKEKNLDSEIIPLSALTYSEKRYVDNQAVNTLNTFAAREYFAQKIRRNRKYALDASSIESATDDINEVLEGDYEYYSGQPFMDELNRYADMAMVINSLEFIESLYRLIRMAKKELFELIDLYSSIGGSLSSTNRFIYELLEHQLKKISSSFTISSARRIDDAFENLISNAGFQQADENLLSGLEGEIGKLRSDAIQDSQKLKQNLNHHIVLYRMRNKHGVPVKVPVNPNYENWCKLIDHIRFFAFSKSFSGFTAYLMDMVKRIEKTSINLNGTIVQSLNTELTNITTSIDKEVEIAKCKLREYMGTRANGGDIAEIENIYKQTADFYDAVSQRFKNYVDECVNEVEETIGTNDNCQRLLDDLVKEANKNQDALNNELRKITNSFADSLVTTGSWFENTHLVESNQLIRTIKNDFVFQENWRYQFIATLGHRLAITCQCRDAAQFKKAIVLRPIKVLNKRTGNLLDTLKNDNHDGTTSGKVVFYTELLEKLSKGLQGNPDNSFKGIKMDSAYESEFENVKDVSFDELYIDISNKLEKAEG